MDKLAPILYKSYGTYCNKQKMLPNIIDGTLPVQKRVLLGCHTWAKNWLKTNAVLGQVMAAWHPHSEALGTAEQLVQNGFVDGSGLWGTREGIEPIGCAAMRYTKLKANKFIEDMAFKYIDHVKWEEDEMDPEPVYIPTMIPFCLMQKYELSMIGFGFKTEIPCYKRSDLIKRLLFLMNIGPRIDIIPHVDGCIVGNGDYIDILTKGSGKISVQGLHKVDKVKKIIEVKGWSTRTSFPTLLGKIDKYKKWNLLSNNDIAFIDQTGNGGNTNIIFEVSKQRNVDTIFKKMVEAITESLNTVHSYNMYVVDENSNVVMAGVDEMLIKAFNHYKLAFESYLNDTTLKLNSQINEYEIINNIRPHISDAIATSGNDIEKSIEYLVLKTSLNADDIKSVMEKYRIKRLLSISIDIQKLKDEVIYLADQLKNSNQVCIDSYGSLI